VEALVPEEASGESGSRGRPCEKTCWFVAVLPSIRCFYPDAPIIVADSA
jgi:hypothetical protein